ncbi:MAG: tyrosine-type recombinase/integrase [Bacteroidota bacterium]
MTHPKHPFGSGMGQKLKAPKGEITVNNCDGRIRLRWRYEGVRYSLNLPFAYEPENIHYATVKVTEIKLDILKGCFDTTLKRYEYNIPAKSDRKKVNQVQPANDATTILFVHELAPKFTEWGKHIRNVDIDNSIDYLYTRRWLEKCINVSINSIAKLLNSEDWAVTTYNRRLTYLNTFLNWLFGIHAVERNPLKDVCKKREKSKRKCSRRNPLEEGEITALLKAIKNNSYCSNTAQFKHSHYYSFLFFIFHTGVRNAEAIGLKVKHIDVPNMQIEISETFARTVKGTNHAARISKGTKMQNIRYLPLTSELLSILQPQISGRKPDDFVFTSPKGLTIDDKMLKRRVLKPVMAKLKLGDRDLYVARHSFGTRAVQQGMVLTEVAYLMGHSTVETAMRKLC